MSFDLVVFSHLRWDFVYQRPQHLLSRAARERRVLFIEEPIHSDEVRFTVRRDASGVAVCTPHLPHDLEPNSAERLLQQWVETLVESQRLSNYAVWFYTPMMLPLARHLKPKTVIYDCMDELSAFKNAPRELIERERELLKTADVVFTGGYSLYEAKRSQHENVHAMPSSVDALHFGQARNDLPEPAELAGIPHPRVGFIGVIDERMDLELLAGMASLRPQVQFVMVGPVVKIDPTSLPQAHNIHYLGGRSYAQLPAYLAHWDAAMLPFALNESTRFISPTKTPEYLAAGCPVVSTPIRDVVRPYGEQDLVQIASTAEEFAQCLDRALHEDNSERCARADKLIGGMSWDLTWRKMEGEISKAMLRRTRPNVPATQSGAYPSILTGALMAHETALPTAATRTVAPTGGSGGSD
jgi:UDP-galactopyranose mutase